MTPNAHLRNTRPAVILSDMPSSPTHANSALLRWRVWPARDWPQRTMLAVTVIAALGIASALLFESSTAAGIAVGCMLLANIRFFLPSDYCLDSESITLAGWFGTRRLPLSSIQLVRFDERGGLLAQRARPGPFASLRGVPLLFPREGGAAVSSTLRELLAVHCIKVVSP